MNKKKLIPILFGTMVLFGIGGLIVYASNSCDEQCKATKEVQAMITQAQLDYMEKKTESEKKEQEYNKAQQEKESAKKELDKLFERNRQLLDGNLVENENSMEKLDMNKLNVNGSKEKIFDRLMSGMILEHNYIIIHHTATSPNATIQSIKNGWDKKYGKNHFPAHYVIAKDGSYENIKDINLRAGGTRSEYYNYQAIQIELIGNFNTAPPTISQYKTLQKIINNVEKEVGKKLEIIGHRDASTTACPGKLINMEFIKYNIRDFGEKEWNKFFEKSQSTGTYLGNYIITQYHPGYGHSMNDSEAQGGSYDIAASGLPLKNKYAGKVVACPPELPIGKNGDLRTVLYVEGVGQVECVDRGGKIKGKHLDLFVGLGKVGYNNRMNKVFMSGDNHRDVYLLYSYEIK